MNTSTAPAWVHQKALEVARRFTQDTEPQRRASLQVAVVEAMMFTRPELASSPQQVVDPVGAAPRSLDEQIASAQAEVATWTKGQRIAMRLQGGGPLQDDFGADSAWSERLKEKRALCDADDAAPALRTPIKMVPGSDLHFTMLGSPMHFNLLTGKDRQDMLAFGRLVWSAALATHATTKAEPAKLPDPLGCRACVHPDCGRFDGPRSVECRAMADNACDRPSLAARDAQTPPSVPDPDARRYREFIGCGLPITYLGEDYHSKAELDAAIDETAASVPSDFPPRILSLLREVADRKGTATQGPFEDADGMPLQDDADAALAWLSRAADSQGKEAGS